MTMSRASDKTEVLSCFIPGYENAFIISSYGEVWDIRGTGDVTMVAPLPNKMVAMPDKKLVDPEALARDLLGKCTPRKTQIVVTEEKVIEMYIELKSVRKVAKILGVSHMTVARMLR
jgi:Helix-turn-helix domain